MDEAVLFTLCCPFSNAHKLVAHEYLTCLWHRRRKQNKLTLLRLDINATSKYVENTGIPFLWF
jgi:hypothetical protein